MLYEVITQKETTPNDVVTVIATQPLTNNEAWQKMQSGQMNVFRLGEMVFTRLDKEKGA